ncbi:MAG: diacylglycerol kinase family protein [Acidobacteriota bacterium]
MKDNKKTLFIVNPKAGKGSANKYFEKVYDQLKEKFSNPDLIISKYPGHLYEIGKDAVKKRYERIISMGGDGTPYEIINGIYNKKKENKNIEFGFLPAGTGNSFLRDFSEISVEKILNRILESKNRVVDLAQFNLSVNDKIENKYFLNILGIGLIADILKLTNERFKFLGPAGYGLGVLARLFKGMKNRIHLDVDGREYEFRNSAMVISNSKYTGGTMKIAPDAVTDDGKVNIIVFNEVDRRDILKIFSGIFKGSHLEHPKVVHLTGSRIKVNTEPEEMVMADGELIGKTPVNMKVLPKELKILV